MTSQADRELQVLLVDDQVANVKILAGVLEDQYTVRFATSGRQALEMARSSTPPDLILLDVVMPDMDGFEVCEQLKARASTAEIPVIFLTAMDDQVNEEKGLSVGAVDYIPKPIKAAVVRARVGVHLRLRRHQKFLESLLDMQSEQITTEIQQELARLKR